MLAVKPVNLGEQFSQAATPASQKTSPGLGLYPPGFCYESYSTEISCESKAIEIPPLLLNFKSGVV